ncbi:hypothetical protein, partial [Flavobacterium aurantiibacter]
AEYLPFGEIVTLANSILTPIKNKCLVRKLLVDEHKNSNNSPFKFNEGGALKNVRWTFLANEPAGARAIKWKPEITIMEQGTTTQNGVVL